ncbi:uncharacterized protein LOC121376339 [Gigantopelta aegis]|uniref:uncharacterized protein LOC121376339 n=1 Tax=Gigantopelta aegis TaxID=1735272 RepID=UPI001B88C21D|nr:uncharacterized protein LOC121376339 [Gigantopelta aegis]
MKPYCISLILIFGAGYAFGQNIALNAQTKQSSTWKGIYTSDRAVDGNTGKMFFTDTCTHTDCNDQNPSWTVCLGQMQTITSVTIHNPDKARGRLKNIRIDVFATNPSIPGAVAVPCATVTSTPVADGTAMNFTCPLGVVGQYIRISKTTMARQWRWRKYGCDALLLCEVEVTGTPVVNCPAGFMQNGQSCYFFSTVNVPSWFDARAACQALGADLVVVNDQAEDNFLRMQLIALGNNMMYFAGLQMLNGMSWMWIDPNAMMGVPNTGNNNGAAFSNWQAGQGMNAAMPCMEYQFVDAATGYIWFGVPCNQAVMANWRDYICEISPTFPVKPSLKCF